ncbi:DUF6527 family protein [Ralstonia mannitolilytica]|uniref:DUF6527 family protein n=1 Tax=Ralstonia mannitolilytica TaxID=105219 RepID=UPI0039B4875E
MLGRLLRVIADFFGFLTKPSGTREELEPAYTLRSFGDRASAAAAARQNGVAALVHSNGHGKWLLLRCPCGCNQQIALNLMQSHSPRWRVERGAGGSFSVHPSVDATSCGAHFWLRDGRVIWCQ